MTFDDWEVDPWGDTVDVRNLLTEFFDLDLDAINELNEIVSEVGVFPPFPRVKPVIRSREPEGYDIRALTEAGCSPAEAVDYQMTEILAESQTGWAKIRGIDQSTVSGNAKQAERLLKN